MISNITNALPVFLKNLKSNDNKPIKESFNLLESLKFYNSLFPSNKNIIGLKHLYFDVIFKLKPEKIDLLKSFFITADTIDFLKEFKYLLNDENGTISIRGNMEEFAVLSLILIGSIRELKPSDKNKSIFISMCSTFLEYCLNNEYHVCKDADLELLEEYNKGFEEEMFDSIFIIPSPESQVATFHFVGIEFNKDILCIFEKYKNVSFTYNNENASFIISMKADDWDDFWNNAPEYLKNEFTKM